MFFPSTFIYEKHFLYLLPSFFLHFSHEHFFPTLPLSDKSSFVFHAFIELSCFLMPSLLLFCFYFISLWLCMCTCYLYCTPMFFMLYMQSSLILFFCILVFMLFYFQKSRELAKPDLCVQRAHAFWVFVCISRIFYELVKPASRAQRVHMSMY